MDKTQIEKALEPLLSTEGMELVDVRVGRHGKKSMLQFFLDKIEGGITLDDCERMSEKIGSVLDVSNLVDGAYVLEVSSPGMDRVLKKESHFLRFMGQRARIRLKLPLEGSRVYYGNITEFKDGCVVIADSMRTYRFPLSDIEEARLDPLC